MTNQQLIAALYTNRKDSTLFKWLMQQQLATLKMESSIQSPLWLQWYLIEHHDNGKLMRYLNSRTRKAHSELYRAYLD